MAIHWVLIRKNLSLAGMFAGVLVIILSNTNLIYGGKKKLHRTWQNLCVKLFKLAMLKQQFPGYHHLEALKLFSPSSLPSSHTYILCSHPVNLCLIILLLVIIICIAVRPTSFWSRLLCWARYRRVRHLCQWHKPGYTQLKRWIKRWGKDSSCKCNYKLCHLQLLEQRWLVGSSPNWRCNKYQELGQNITCWVFSAHLSCGRWICLSFKSVFLGTAVSWVSLREGSRFLFLFIFFVCSFGWLGFVCLFVFLINRIVPDKLVGMSLKMLLPTGASASLPQIPVPR